MQRERKDNEDHRVQAPFQNHLLNVEEEVEELEYEYLDWNINHLEEESYEIFLTKAQYKNYGYFDDFSYSYPTDIYQTYPKSLII